MSEYVKVNMCHVAKILHESCSSYRTCYMLIVTSLQHAICYMPRLGGKI